MKTLKELYQQVYQQAVNEGNKQHHSDKGTHHSYIDKYENIFEPYRDKPINLLELGVNYGYSMLLWEKYFTAGNIFGIDIQDLSPHRDKLNITIGGATDSNVILNAYSDMLFDIIIDDASHDPVQQILSLEILYPRLKSGGVYIVEDIRDIDSTRSQFDKYNPDIYDNRAAQNISDDVLVIIRK
jgi:predicted O-methyltransferase YrrM